MGMGEEQKYSIAMIASEAAPYAKTGGLGDMVAALAMALAKNGHKTRLIMPRYASIDLAGKKILLDLELPFASQSCRIYSADLGFGVLVYFLDYPPLFGREGIYGNSTAQPFHDNAARFSFLCRAALALCRALDWRPDILHMHDWPSALVAPYRDASENRQFFARAACVFTIHNLAYQGFFSQEQLAAAGFYAGCPSPEILEPDGSLNFIKTGLLQADLLTAVSPSYAQEIMTPEYGCGLQGLLQERQERLIGILNGADYDEWSPQTDRYIEPFYFNAEDLTGKQRVKELLQKETGLPVRPHTPVLGLTMRLAEQKGIGPLLGPAYGSLYSICADLDIQTIILGTGDYWAEEELRSLAARLSNLKVFLAFDNRLAHLIEAGSDFFLMPSQYEPCGLNQIYSLKYGSLPIVRAVGGLKDTVEPHSSDRLGDGFMFEPFTPQAIYDVVAEAVSLYHTEPATITAMRKKAMQKDFSWEKGAQQYQNAYKKALAFRFKDNAV